MTDAVYRAIANALTGYVEAPAGCGKTEAIVKTVGEFCCGPQLVLTHTHAGVNALRHRFRTHKVHPEKYHVDTIAGWAWSWVKKYPVSSGYQGSIDIAEWNDVYKAMTKLLRKEFVRKVIRNSYDGVIVDEYQDCTTSMHQLIVGLKNILPCRVLGDPLQGIFGFRDPLVNWTDVTGEFSKLGTLDTPHRWINAQNEPLGRWLLGIRDTIAQAQEPEFAEAPIERKSVSYSRLGPELITLTHQKQGRICIIGPKSRSLKDAMETTLVKNKYKLLEPNELTTFKDFVVSFSNGSETEKSEAVLIFIKKAFSGLGGQKRFIEKLVNGESQRPREQEKLALCTQRRNGVTANFMLELFEFIKLKNEILCKRIESVSALQCLLEEHIETGEGLRSLYASEITKRKHQNRSNLFRCFGSTLLLKGLEFDHAIIVRERNWGTQKDLYVALTRGSKSVTLMEVGN